MQTRTPISSFRMNLMTAPPNLTTLFNPALFNLDSDFTIYSGPNPRARGIGQLELAAAATSLASGGLSIAQQIGNFLVPSVTGMQAQDATTLVNGLEVFLKRNLATFQANPTPENQSAALSAFDQIWNVVVSGCSQFAGPGTKCVNDRSPGGKWDWWAMYYNPIANAKVVTAAAPGSVITQTGQPVITSSGISYLPLIIGAAIIFFLMSSMGGGNGS